MRMRDVLWQIWLNCGYFLTVAASGFFLYKLCAPLCPPPEWALLEGAALSDPGWVHRHGDLDR